MSLTYHLQELALAADTSDGTRSHPDVRPSDRVVLDIGCGIGQTLLALHTDAHLVGLDVDEEAIRYGFEHYPHLQLLVASGDAIPLPGGVFDLVFSRVALPYMNIPRAVAEAHRVLKPGGRFWMTLHTREHVEQFAREARGLRMWLYHRYVLANGWIFKHTGRVLPLLGRYESWQDQDAMCELLARAGFSSVVVQYGQREAIEATKT